jgi:phosphatidylglycerol:prolipoprotein diacylglycerol transferase
MLFLYQHLPERINPIAFSIGNFDMRWYSVMYLIGFLVVYYLLMHRVKTDKQYCHSGLDPESTESIVCKSFKNVDSRFRGNDMKNLILNFLVCSFAGLLIGARLGYVLFYDFNYFIQNPLAVISPFENGSFVGIFGMSYFGGLVGIIIASITFCRINKINFWQWADFVIPAVPAGYFFGRIGNFLNGELYGKATDHFWGMYFGNGILRHPTQLYEALLEGILLFAILWFLRNSSPTTFSGYANGFVNKIRKVVRGKLSGHLLFVYLIGYGVVRFFVEFYREQDQSLILGLTRGQMLSLAVIVLVLIFANIKHSRKKIVKTKK